MRLRTLQATSALDTCFLTVSSPISSCRAISALVRPRATSVDDLALTRRQARTPVGIGAATQVLRQEVREVWAEREQDRAVSGSERGLVVTQHTQDPVRRQAGVEPEAQLRPDPVRYEEALDVAPLTGREPGTELLE